MQGKIKKVCGPGSTVSKATCLGRQTFITRATLDQNAQQVTACIRQGPEMTLMALGTAVIATVLLELNLL